VLDVEYTPHENTCPKAKPQEVGEIEKLTAKKVPKRRGGTNIKGEPTY